MHVSVSFFFGRLTAYSIYLFFRRLVKVFMSLFFCRDSCKPMPRLIPK